MKFRFIHAADIHLGYEQYHQVERANDFARAYLDMVTYSVDAGPDFVLIAGDLFHRASADAWMLKQATAGLTMLRDAGIPVIAIEGNHDVQHAKKNLSWMEFLCDQELLILLDMEAEPNGYKSLVPFDPVERRGSYVDVAGARVYGLKFRGAATPRVLEEIVPMVEPGPGGYTIMMLHAGMEGQVPHMHGGLTPAQVGQLHPPVDYLALGHIHKRLLEDWILNPGSTETNSMEEMDWPHGFLDVLVDTDAWVKHTVTPVSSPHARPFHRISVPASEDQSLEDYMAAVEDRIQQERAIEEGAVIELHLGGVAAFKRQDVPVDRLQGLVDLQFRPLVARVRNNLTPPGLVTVPNRERASRAELERQVVEYLVQQQAGYRSRAEEWVHLIMDVKNMAMERDTPASIADHVQAKLANIQGSSEGSPDISPALSPSATHILGSDAAPTSTGLEDRDAGPSAVADDTLIIGGELVTGPSDIDEW